MLVERVFVLMLENRSFDHLLGFSGITGKDAETGLATEVIGLSGSESNLYNGLRYAVEKVFGFPPLTERDRRVRDVTPLISLPEPRPTPATLPERAAPAGPAPALAQDAGKAGDGGPIDQGSLPGLLHIAQRYDLALSAPPQHPAIMARVTGITTRGQARQYLEEVAAKAAAARSSRGL